MCFQSCSRLLLSSPLPPCHFPSSDLTSRSSLREGGGALGASARLISPERQSAARGDADVGFLCQDGEKPATCDRRQSRAAQAETVSQKQSVRKHNFLPFQPVSYVTTQIQRATPAQQETTAPLPPFTHALCSSRHLRSLHACTRTGEWACSEEKKKRSDRRMARRRRAEGEPRQEKVPRERKGEAKRRNEQHPEGPDASLSPAESFGLCTTKVPQLSSERQSNKKNSLSGTGRDKERAGSPPASLVWLILRRLIGCLWCVH